MYMIFKFGDKEVKVVFLREQHLDLLNSYNIDLSQLPYLPRCNEVTDEDCLDWLKFQRAVEKQYCGFKSTTYDYSGDIKIGNINREGAIYKAKYNEVLNGDPSVILGDYFYFHEFNGKLFILNSNNTVNSSLFKSVQGNLASSLYQSLLSAFSMFELYFRENTTLKETVTERKHIDLGFVLSKVM